MEQFELMLHIRPGIVRYKPIQVGGSAYDFIVVVIGLLAAGTVAAGIGKEHMYGSDQLQYQSPHPLSNGLEKENIWKMREMTLTTLFTQEQHIAGLRDLRVVSPKPYYWSLSGTSKCCYLTISSLSCSHSYFLRRNNQTVNICYSSSSDFLENSAQRQI